MTKTAKMMLTAVLLVGSALAQTKQINIGKATYIGEDPSGTSLFSINITKNAKFVTQPTIQDIVVYEQGQSGDTQAFGTVKAPAGFLFAFGPTNSMKSCTALCPVVTVQLVLSTSPTATYQLTTGESFTAYSIQNAFIQVKQGVASLQVGQSTPIVIHSVTQ